jgi:hypothetical protein
MLPAGRINENDGGFQPEKSGVFPAADKPANDDHEEKEAERQVKQPT